MLNWIVNLLRSLLSFFVPKRNVPQATRSNVIASGNLAPLAPSPIENEPRIIKMLRWFEANIGTATPRPFNAERYANKQRAKNDARNKKHDARRAKDILTLRRKFWRAMDAGRNSVAEKSYVKLVDLQSSPLTNRQSTQAAW